MNHLPRTIAVFEIIRVVFDRHAPLAERRAALREYWGLWAKLFASTGN